MRPKDCIYHFRCGNPTGSAEHITLAALGSRRKHKGILCHPCNQGFSDLDDRLAAQLHPFNALLGIRSDYAKVSRTVAAVNSSDGEPYQLDSFGHARTPGPRVISTAPGEQTVAFDNEQQVQAFIVEQRKKGITVQIRERRTTRKLLGGHHVVSWEYGGRDAHREIARLALNVVAYLEPEIARHSSLEDVKRFILGEAVANPVLDLAGNPDPRLPPSAFEFTHRFVIGMDAAGGDLWAEVGFFGAFRYGLMLGHFAVPRTGTIVFDVNPLAEAPARDIHREEVPGYALARPSIQVPPIDLPAAVKAAMEALIPRILDHQWSLSAPALLATVNESRQLHPEGRTHAVSQALRTNEQRLLNLLRGVAAIAQNRLGADDPVACRCASAVAPAAQITAGVSTETLALIEKLRDSIARRVSAILDSRALLDSELRDLLEGSGGMELAAEVLISAAAHSTQLPRQGT